MGRRAAFAAGLGAAVLWAAGAAQAATTPIAPACTASVAHPSWADCAGPFEGNANIEQAEIQAASLAEADAPTLEVAIVSGPSHAPVSATPLVPAIPEPPSYTLMLAGLAAVGFMVLRRWRRF